MNERITIRKLKREEASKIGPLMLDLYKKWDDIDPIDEIDKSWFFSKGQEKYVQEILDDKNKLILVAVLDESEIVGYVSAEIENRKPFLKKVGYIDEAYVKPGYRGEGIASELLTKIFEWFDEREITWITLETNSFDEQAISFWENQGFEEFNKFFKLKKGKRKI